jgi:uncharacterized protein YndB with AHSA1/START domain
MSRWFVVDPTWVAKVTNDFRIGGHYRIEMTRDDGSLFVAHGEYRDIAPVTRLVFTWNSPVAQATLVTIELEPVGELTDLMLTHELFPDADTAVRDGAGWEGCLANLARLVEAGA